MYNTIYIPYIDVYMYMTVYPKDHLIFYISAMGNFFTLLQKFIQSKRPEDEKQNNQNITICVMSHHSPPAQTQRSVEVSNNTTTCLQLTITILKLIVTKLITLFDGTTGINVSRRNCSSTQKGTSNENLIQIHVAF